MQRGRRLTAVGPSYMHERQKPTPLVLCSNVQHTHSTSGGHSHPRVGSAADWVANPARTAYRDRKPPEIFLPGILQHQYIYKKYTDAHK